MRTYTASAAGVTAAEIIHQGNTATVMGLTSRGVFCNLGDGRVFFLSYENWRGPLTVNLNLETESSVDRRYLLKEQRIIPLAFSYLSPDSKVSLTRDGIQFGDLDVTVLTADVPTWKADLHPINESGLSAARSHLKDVARTILADGIHKGWKPLISRWAGMQFLGERDAALNEVEVELHHLAEGFRSGDKEAVLRGMGYLMGRGSGLTPSGDDFIIGLLLGLRATAGLSQNFKLIIQVSESLENLARLKTTTLSANMIACALEGQADERLISALDGILRGSLNARECAKRLTDYGSSSGGDTLLGMAMAIQLAA